MFIRRFFAFVISAFLIFFPAYSYATTSLGGWTATDTIIAGANTTINAVKNGANGALKSAITVAPSASKVGKFLIKGGGTAALLIAVPQLLGDGVDWVLDPENNAVKYTSSTAVDGTGYYIDEFRDKKYASPSSACHGYVQSGSDRNGVPVGDYWGLTFVSIVGNVCTVRYAGNNVQRYVSGSAPDTNEEDKYLPIDTVAAQVISNAAAGDVPSQDAVKATALEGFAAGEHDNALDAAAEPDVGTDNPTDNPTDPNNPAEPSTPFDPSSIIAAINSLKAMLAGILSSVTGFFDWAQEDAPQEQEPVPVPYGDLSDVGLDGVDRYEQRIDFTGQCPASDFSVSILGVNYSQPIPYEHLCRFLIALAPWLLAMTYLGTAYFVVENT